ncbi:MAG TPA: ribose-5-phosphate isomerase RpiA [Trueperaceae bacterium]|nr:ribose-5-phosphate isomerase RpiA [Trueperaceae bacterium]
MSEEDRRKREAALRAVALVESGMTVGLGTGSTARHFVAELGSRLATRELERVSGVPTSRETAHQAGELGIPLRELGANGVDLAVDGMDEYDDGLNAIKGLGGALLREKVVAAAATTFVLIGDSSKHVARLGDKAPVPVEVAAFGWHRTARELENLGAEPAVRLSQGEPFVSDNGNLILDCRFPGGLRPAELARELCGVPGVLAHGMFLGMAHRAFVATGTGTLDLVPGQAS